MSSNNGSSSTSVTTGASPVVLKKPRQKKKEHDLVPTYLDVLAHQKKQREKQTKKFKKEFLEWFTKNIVSAKEMFTTSTANRYGTERAVSYIPPRFVIVKPLKPSQESIELLASDSFDLLHCLNSALPSKMWQIVRTMPAPKIFDNPINIIVDAVDITTMNTMSSSSNTVTPKEASSKRKTNIVADAATNITTTTTTTTMATLEPSSKKQKSNSVITITSNTPAVAAATEDTKVNIYLDETRATYLSPPPLEPATFDD